MVRRHDRSLLLRAGQLALGASALGAFYALYRQVADLRLEVQVLSDGLQKHAELLLQVVLR